jgi:hypothetical protein
MSALLLLANRCEQATGPDSELDKRLGRAIGWHPAGVDGRLLQGDAAWLYENKCPAYTASLDAATMLVPEGCGWSVHRYASGLRARAGVYIDDGRDKGHYLNAATPALALCSAALRARAAQ